MAESDLINAKTCTSWAPPEVIRELHHSQAGDGRHKCAVCAWQQGYEQGKSEALAGLVELEARIAALESESR